VTLLCGPRGAGAAALLPGVDQVIVRRAEWIDPEAPPLDRADLDAYIDAIAAVHADAAVVLTSFHQSPLPSAFVLRLAGVSRIAAISEDFPGSLLDHRLPDPGDVHESQRALAVAGALGFTLPEGDDGRLAVRATEPATALPERFVVVHPGASVPARAWAPERNRDLVAALERAGRDVVVTGGPAERALTAFVAGPARDGVSDLGGATSLSRLAGVLARADAVVAGNTGPAHLAAAVGTPVVSLFSPVVPAERWAPYGVPTVLLGDQSAPCRNTRARECPVPGHPCLTSVTAQDVVAAVGKLCTVQPVAAVRIDVAPGAVATEVR
jgi:ADP-heptose:LPS heptosyltransferase